MDDLQFREARLRIGRWIEDTAGVFAYLPVILHEHESLRDRLEATERASSRLLQEVNDLRREIETLQSENERLRRERAETAAVLTDGLHRVLEDTVRRLRAPAAAADMARQPTFLETAERPPSR
jgi:regulator of replication initiation timing